MLDPYRTLGISTDAGDEAIHQAYLQQIRKYPPERHPQEFKAVRHAYELLETRHKRLQYELFDTEQPTLPELLELALSKGESCRPDADALRQAIRQSLASAHMPVPTVDK